MEGHVAPRGTWEFIYHVRPLRRGDYQFGDLSLRWLGPLGLVIRQANVDAKEPVKVYPNLLDVRRYDLLLRRNRLQEMGLRTTRQFGEGTEFERLREYLPDDEYRRINWKATARRNFPVTTEYQTERSQQVIAVLDAGRMMQSPVADIAKLDYVVNAVLLLTYVATGKGDRVGMLSFADDVMHYLSPRQGRGQFYRMLELLYGRGAAARGAGLSQGAGLSGSQAETPRPGRGVHRSDRRRELELAGGADVHAGAQQPAAAGDDQRPGCGGCFTDEAK